MSRNDSDLVDCGIEEEVDPKTKFNSLISVTISTLMCVAAKCPVPKSNVETTLLFLSTIANDSGDAPRNIKGFLSLLKNYSGPFESDLQQKEKKESTKEKEPKVSPEAEAPTKGAHNQIVPVTECQGPGKRSSKNGLRRTEKDQKRPTTKTVGSRISPSKSVISKL